MAHNLFRDSMVYVGETPWHGLGKKVESSASAAEFLRAGNLDWQVRLAPAAGAKQDGRGRWNRMTIMRDPVEPEPDPVALGMVTSRYKPLQNTEAFAFFDPLIATDWARYEAAGALGDGETVWVQVRLRDDMKVQEDETIERYLLLRNRHNGEGAVSIRFTPIRVVCQNTLSAAECGSTTFAKVRHTGAMHDRLAGAAADAMMNEIEAFAERSRRTFAAMVARALKAQERLDLLTQLCGPPPKGPAPDNLPSRREMAETRLAAQSAVDPQAGSETAWALYNAITWAEDERARLRARKDPEAGLNAMWFGGGADNKIKALKVLAAVSGMA
ncbi:DUF932 domain-containing protein [Humitalea sp. 24SJ18S-53]|uniref:DUF932 domain-containing protein n=1 Tax=Humitalea sp. 24SJ18S-53 TaxID=3422307 RepID=UPI003D664D06